MSYNITIELLGCNSNTGTIQVLSSNSSTTGCVEVLSCTSTSAENSEGSPYNYVFRSETGSFYPYYSNPLGYLTSAVANSGGVLSINSISGNLILTGAGSVSITTGIDGYIYISGSAVGNSSNISGLISTGDADLRYYSITNPNNYINSGNTGNLIARWESGNFYGIENTNNYSTSGNLAASGADLLNRQQLLSGNLINSGILLYNSDSIISGKLISLSGDLITYINNDNQTGNLVGRWETGQFYSIDNINNYANSGDLGRYAILTGDNSFSGSNTFTTSIQITNNAAVGGTLILHAPDGSTATPNHSKIRAGFISAQRTLTTPDKNGLIAVISDLSGYYLSGNGELLSGNLITTGFNLNNKIISLSGDLINSGILLLNSDSIISGKLLSLSGDFISNNSSIASQITTINSNLTSTGQTLLNHIISLSGDVLSTEITLLNSDSIISGKLISLSGDTLTLFPRNETGVFYPLYNPNNYTNSGNLAATGTDLLNRHQALSGNLINSGILLYNSDTIISGKLLSLSGDLGSTGQNLNNQLRAIQSSGITGISITGGAALTGLLNITGNYGVQTVQLGNTICISGLINKWTGFCGDGTSTGIVLNINLNDNNICWSLRETGNNKEFVYPTSYISGNSLVLKFSSGWAPTLNQYIFTAIG